MKKSQIQPQILINIFGLVVIALVLAIGYFAVTRFSAQKREVQIVNFKDGFEDSVLSVSSEYGSELVESFSVPNDFTEICFIEATNSDDLSSGFVENHPIIADAAETQENVFLIGPASILQ